MYMAFKWGKLQLWLYIILTYMQPKTRLAWEVAILQQNLSLILNNDVLSTATYTNALV